MELCPESQGWTDGMKTYGIWLLPSLWVKLRSKEGAISLDIREGPNKLKTGSPDERHVAF